MTTSVKETCRDIDELLPVARKAIILFFYVCHKRGIKIFVTETYRSLERQKYLYAQGRTRPGKVVTWTLDSNHKGRLAWDIGASTLGGVSDIYDSTVLKKAGAVAKELGITWGGTWPNNLDYPHFEVTANWKMPAGYDMANIKVSVPTRSNIPITVTDSVSKLPRPELTVPDNKLEEGNILVKNIPTIGDASSPTIRATFINTIKKALADGVINDKDWLKAAEDGTLSIVDAVLLKNHIEQYYNTNRDLSVPTLQDSLIGYLKEARADNIINSDQWLQKAEKKTLTTADMIGLHIHIEQERTKKKSSK